MDFQNNLPIRGNGLNKQIEIRPAYVEEWLDALPYIDFINTSRLMHEGLSATNKIPMKPAQRMELVKLYNRPYQYYLDSQIRTGAQHTLQTIETIQNQVHGMKNIAIDMGLACRTVLNDSLNQKTLWGQDKPYLDAALMALKYLSHALIFSYLEYSPTPRNFWRELNSLYEFAESLDQHQTLFKSHADNDQNSMTTIENAYKHIALASLLDPHQLPFGSIWEIFDQLKAWTEYANLRKFETLNDTACSFVINLGTDMRPIPYYKFKLENASSKHRLLDTSMLHNIAKKHYDLLVVDKNKTSELSLSPYYTKPLLETMLKSWGMPPKRSYPRAANTGKYNVACGISSVYFHVNNKEEFIMVPTHQQHDDIVSNIDDVSDFAHTNKTYYSSDEWNLVNESAGGIAISKTNKPDNAIKVGNLVCFNQDNTSNDWSIGVIRWLMVKQKTNYQAGIEKIAGNIFPAAIRAISGNQTDCEYKRAFLIGNPEENTQVSVITYNGLYDGGRKLEIFFQGNQYKITARGLIDSSVGFEQFSYKLN